MPCEKATWIYWWHGRKISCVLKNIPSRQQYLSKNVPFNMNGVHYKYFFVFMFMFTCSWNNILEMHLQPLGVKVFKEIKLNCHQTHYYHSTFNGKCNQTHYCYYSTCIENETKLKVADFGIGYATIQLQARTCRIWNTCI
jgi:hypothetical protein